MSSAIRKHLNPATVLAFIALVFAMTGGAFAMNGGGAAAGHTASTGLGSNTAIVAKSKPKPKAKAGPRGPAGPRGATGATGPAGPAGSAGATGPAGGAGPQGPAGNEGAAGHDGKEGAKGKEGKTGFTKTLPAGETEQGEWSLTLAADPEAAGEPHGFGAISFVIPLPTAPTAVHLKEGEGGTEECPGTAAEPKAKGGFLCVYTAAGETFVKFSEAKASTFGALVHYHGEGAEFAGISVHGSWAVTG